jgi:hypothetical protein
MNILLAPACHRSAEHGPHAVAEGFRHPSLHAKKYDETEDKWQGSITGDWRFYFKVEAGTYQILDLTPSNFRHTVMTISRTSRLSSFSRTLTG